MDGCRDEAICMCVLSLMYFKGKRPPQIPAPYPYSSPKSNHCSVQNKVILKD